MFSFDLRYHGLFYDKSFQSNNTDQARHVRNEVSALPDTRDKLARV